MEDFTKMADATGLTPEALAAELGVSLSTLWRYKTGRSKKIDNTVVDKLRAITAAAS